MASFVRTDPARARELLVEFAEFTRYSFRQHGDFTSLAEELRCIDRCLLLERARFGGRLNVSLRVAPEVLSVVVPFLRLQPLVENAVRHGLERREGPGHLVITAEDGGTRIHRPSGRLEAAQREATRPATGRPRVAPLYGPPGIGTTAVALHLGAACHTRFPDGQF
jgi:LytS/YehU family sensor histidine kinase